MKCLESGRTCGNGWLRSACDFANAVTGTGVPPTAGTRYRTFSAAGAKTMTPSRRQAPPRPEGASQTTRLVPPSAAILCRRPALKKAIHCPSGDQNGKACASASTSLRASSNPRDRTHSALVPSDARATNAILRPSGDTSGTSTDVFSGGSTTSRVATGAISRGRAIRPTTKAASTPVATKSVRAAYLQLLRGEDREKVAVVVVGAAPASA